jgi:asparagine synthase (glutamine-hydrolysing)
VWANRHDGPQASFATDSLQSWPGAASSARPSSTLLNEHLPAHPGYYGEMVWILMMLEQWLSP